MKNLRIHGKNPFRVALIHGGPGARGEMKPVAENLSRKQGILEPLQTATSIDGQIGELKSVFSRNADLPVTLVGFSWGAWLSFLFAAEYPRLVRKIMLTGCGGLEESDGIVTIQTRMSRLDEENREKVICFQEILKDPDATDKQNALIQLGEIFSKTDAFDPFPVVEEGVDVDVAVFENVWTEAEDFRKSGKLIDTVKKIKCPVVAIHGDYDPHPGKRVEKTLSQLVSDFRFISLKDCGHKPWIEQRAREDFYQILEEELSVI